MYGRSRFIQLLICTLIYQTLFPPIHDAAWKSSRRNEKNNFIHSCEVRVFTIYRYMEFYFRISMEIGEE